MKLTEKRLVQIIREEYTNRLLQYEVAARIIETETMDKRGNVLLSKDLKVRHEDSGYEYTIDQIEGEGDNMKIHLRSPEMPRVEPPLVAKRINETETSSDEDIISLEKADDQEQEVFVVSAEEFEKEYIVD